MAERAARAGGACLAVAGALMLFAPAVAGAFPGWDEPEEVRPVSWGLVSRDGPSSITYGVSAGWCVGKPKPRIDHVGVRWRPRAAVITVFLHYPAVHFGKNEACAGVGLGMSAELHLDHSISGRALYDGSTSPPRRRARAPSPARRTLVRVIPW